MNIKRLAQCKHLLELIIVVLVMGLGAQTANAQGGVEARRELELTDALMLKAQRLVIDEGCPSKRAHELLDKARNLQKEAWMAHHREQHRLALSGTKAARGLAQEAIKIAERWRFVVRQIQRIRELLDVATKMVRVSQNPRAAALLETALSQFERGQGALREGQVEQAFHLLKNANKLAREIVTMLRQEDVGQERVGRELDRTDRLIDKARPLIEQSGHEKAQTLLDRGVEAQIRAREFFDQGKYKVAHQLTLKARELVVRALGMVEGPIAPERVRMAIGATDDLMERVRPIIMESQNREAVTLFLSAGNHQDKAKGLLAAQQYKLALAQTKIARRLVDKALELLGEASG
jgi:flagellin-specific chaperone FliS